MIVSCDVINKELLKLLPKHDLVIKYMEFGRGLEGDEEGYFSFFYLVVLDAYCEIRMYEFEYHPSRCQLRESNNGKRWFAKESQHV